MSKKIEKRRVLYLLPLIVLPFLALGFYALGGGQDQKPDKGVKAKGINTALPDAKFKKEGTLDKMGIYAQAQKDSSASREDGFETIALKLGYTPVENAQTDRINEKLAAIHQQINTPDVDQKSFKPGSKNFSEPSGSVSKDVAKLEMLIKGMKDTVGEDPEMKQLSQILQSIQEIQNPEIARQKYPKIPLLEEDSKFQAIPAVIAQTHRAVQGSVVKLRILDTVVISGQMIPKGHEIFGIAEFSNQRLNLEIRTIRLGNSIIPVNLTVFDKRDAMRGINAPEAVLTDAINSGTADAIGGIGLMGFDQNLTTRLAGAGIDAAKSLFTKRLKRIKQKLKEGYPVLLRDNTKKVK